MQQNNSMGNESKNLQVNVLLFVNPSADPVLEIIEIILLGIVFLISFCANIFLLVTIASSYTLRGESFNILIANFCVIFLIETTVNMSFALLYVTTDSWQLGSIGCCISSFSVQLVTIEMTLGLCVGSVESTVSLRQPYQFQKMWTNKKQVITITTFWLAGILICLPLLIHSIKSELFPARYGCSFRDVDGFVYMLFVLIWCYGLMITIGVCNLIHLGFQTYKEYRAQVRRQGSNFSEVFMPGGLWTEWINVKLIACLLCFYLLLELPFVTIHHNTGLNFDFTNNFTAIASSYKYETAFTWFRYLYSCVFALSVLQIRKDIRYKLKALLNCCRSNVIRDHSAVPVTKQDSKKKGNRKDSLPPISLNTPVLYISPEGLCLRQLAPATKSFLNCSNNDRFNKAPNFISYLCDVGDVTVVDTDLNRLDESFTNTSSCIKESKVSLHEYVNEDSFQNESQDILLNDLGTPKSTEAASRKKTVRFAETLTIYRAKSETPDWFLNANNLKVGVKMPRRTFPWKVQLNDTFTISSQKVNRAYEQGSKEHFSREKQSSPLQWVINK